ncbi:MAG TPA: AAA family ATPase, partial [Chloroflexia bacterium]|nr:AAA family ATPase [Chloroflexia bacterium]
MNSHPSPPNHLPLQLTSLVGREREIEAVGEVLRRDEARLVTLTGPPGIGKTRLGIQVAATLLGEFADGAYF